VAQVLFFYDSARIVVTPGAEFDLRSSAWLHRGPGRRHGRASGPLSATRWREHHDGNWVLEINIGTRSLGEIDIDDEQVRSLMEAVAVATGEKIATFNRNATSLTSTKAFNRGDNPRPARFYVGPVDMVCVGANLIVGFAIPCW
jgi:hypothetical protein